MKGDEHNEQGTFPVSQNLVQEIQRLKELFENERLYLLELGQKKYVGDNIDRESLDKLREESLGLMTKLLETEYARTLLEAKHEESIYNSEFKRSSADERPTGFYAPVVRARKSPKSAEMKDGYSICIEWKRYFKGGPEGAKRTMSKNITRRKDHSRYHTHLFKNASGWEKDLITMTEDQLVEIRNRMKKLSELKRKVISLRQPAGDLTDQPI